MRPPLVTLKDLVVSQLEHRESNRVPYGKLSFEEGLCRKISEVWGSDSWFDTVDNALVTAGGLALYGPDPPGDGRRYADAYGSLWVDRDGMPHLVKPAIETSDASAPAAFRFPSVEALIPDAFLERVNRICKENPDRFICAETLHGIWERTWALCGFENALIYSAAEPGFFRDLTGRVTEHIVALVERYGHCDAHGILFADDWGDQRSVILGPERWRQYILPGLRELCAAAHRAGKYTLSHCCGHFTEIVADAAAAGLDCIQSVQPEAMDIGKLKEKYGEVMVFWGGIGSQRLLPFGTPAEIEAEVARIARESAAGGGWILGPAKQLLHGTPVENALALLQALNKAQAGEYRID